MATIRELQNHPTIRDTIKNMVKQGKKTEEIMRVVGMPSEVVDRVRRETERR